jgi:hypothetical protein
MDRHQSQHRLPLPAACRTSDSSRVQKEEERPRSVDALLGHALERGLPQRQGLHQEICEQGYSHSSDTVNRVLSNFRYTEEQGKQLHAPRAKKGSIAGASPSAKNVAALFMRREEKLNKEQKEYPEVGCAPQTQPWPTYGG